MLCFWTSTVKLSSSMVLLSVVLTLSCEHISISMKWSRIKFFLKVQQTFSFWNSDLAISRGTRRVSGPEIEPVCKACIVVRTFWSTHERSIFFIHTTQRRRNGDTKETQRNGDATQPKRSAESSGNQPLKYKTWKLLTCYGYHLQRRGKQHSAHTIKLVLCKYRV